MSHPYGYQPPSYGAQGPPSYSSLNGPPSFSSYLAPPPAPNSSRGDPPYNPYADAMSAFNPYGSSSAPPQEVPGAGGGGAYMAPPPSGTYMAPPPSSAGGIGGAYPGQAQPPPGVYQNSSYQNLSYDSYQNPSYPYNGGGGGGAPPNPANLPPGVYMEPGALYPTPGGMVQNNPPQTQQQLPAQNLTQPQSAALTKIQSDHQQQLIENEDDTEDEDAKESGAFVYPFKGFGTNPRQVTPGTTIIKEQSFMFKKTKVTDDNGPFLLIRKTGFVTRFEIMDERSKAIILIVKKHFSATSDKFSFVNKTLFKCGETKIGDMKFKSMQLVGDKADIRIQNGTRLLLDCHMGGGKVEIKCGKKDLAKAKKKGDGYEIRVFECTREEATMALAFLLCLNHVRS